MNAKSMLLNLPALLLLLVSGCSSTRTIRVPVAPRVDLRAYPTVGLVTFSSNGHGDLDRLSTQRFLQTVQAAQPGTRVVELGSERQVLASVNRPTWDPATLRAIKQTHGVDVIVMGRLDLEQAKPNFQLSTVLKKLSVQADVNAALSAKLLETGSGATMWTNAAGCTAQVAHAAFNNKGSGNFGASDPEAVYGQMIDGLVYRITDDFRVHYVFRQVPKDQVASAGD